jgi:hypothetical protein
MLFLQFRIRESDRIEYPPLSVRIEFQLILIDSIGALVYLAHYDLETIEVDSEAITEYERLRAKKE